jgi:hypothetical protein
MSDPLFLEKGLGSVGRFGSAGLGDTATEDRGVDREMSDKAAFARLDLEVLQWIESIDKGINNIAPRYALKRSIGYLRERSVPMLRHWVREARSHAAAALAAKSQPQRENAIQMAGGRYQAAMLGAELLHLQVNLFIVAGFADESGVPSATIAKSLNGFEARMKPLLDAMATFRIETMRTARARATPDLQQVQEELARALTVIDANLALSNKVIKVADILIIALSIYQAWRIPVRNNPGGPSSSSPPRVGKSFANGTATAIVNTVDLASMVEAIKQLVKIGALDPGVAALVATHAGTSSSPIPELGRPQVMERSAGRSAAPSKPPPVAGRAGVPSPSPQTSAASGRPQALNRTLATLEKHKVNTKDEYTLKKLTEIYSNNRNPEAILMQARSGTGELRVLVRHAREPGVKSVRFVKPTNVKGEVTPDIEITRTDGKVTFVEVRTMTEASPGLKVKDAAGRTRPGVGASPEFINDLDAKIRRGQISTQRPGVIALHAPFQEVTRESLAGWREILKKILARGELSKGIRRIEITGGTGPMLIFEPPKWTGLIVQ